MSGESSSAVGGPADTSSAAQNVAPAGTDNADADASYAGGTPEPSPTVSLPPAVTTPVPAPGGGNVDQTVAAVEVTSQAPVALDQPGDFGGGIGVKVDKVDKITTTAELPGEIAGPGLAMSVTITNSSDAPIDLGAVIVDVTDSVGMPAIPMTAAPASPMSGSLEPGQASSGVYVVTLPQGFTQPTTIAVSYSAGSPVVVFTGSTA